MFQVAWSVARTTSSGTPLDPLAYDQVLVNSGNMWHSSNNSAVIPITGFYFIHIGEGVPTNTRVHLTLHENNNSATSLGLLQPSTNHNGIDTTSRSAILHMSSGDVVTINGRTRVYSDSGLQTIFIGFLLYRD